MTNGQARAKKGVGVLGKTVTPGRIEGGGREGACERGRRPEEPQAE